MIRQAFRFVALCVALVGEIFLVGLIYLAWVLLSRPDRNGY